MTTEYHARLSLPPSLNRTYKTGQGQFYMDPKAKAWKKLANLELMAAGWRSLPPRSGTTFAVSYVIHCAPHRDVDSSSKIIIDAIASRLGIDDKHCMALSAAKDIVRHRNEYGLDVTVTVNEGVPIA